MNRTSLEMFTAKAVNAVRPNGEVQRSPNSRLGYEVTVLSMEEHDDSAEDYSVLVSDDEGNYSDDSSRIQSEAGNFVPFFWMRYKIIEAHK